MNKVTHPSQKFIKIKVIDQGVSGLNWVEFNLIFDLI